MPHLRTAAKESDGAHDNEGGVKCAYRIRTCKLQPRVISRVSSDARGAFRVQLRAIVQEDAAGQLLHCAEARTLGFVIPFRESSLTPLRNRAARCKFAFFARDELWSWSDGSSGFS